MSAEEFRSLGYRLVDRIAGHLESLPQRPVTAGDRPSRIRALLEPFDMPDAGVPPEQALDEAWGLLADHSLYNGHPRFFGYITSSPAPVGVLGDFLASALNPNAGAFILSPMATGMELQTLRWVARFLGYPQDCGGILVSGGNMANIVAFLAARKAKAPFDISTEGAGASRLTVYLSPETHTWVHKAADLSGLGTSSLRYVPVDSELRILVPELRRMIEQDRSAGCHPFLIVGSAGTVSTGAVDPLASLAEVAREQDLWFHVDGAYGAPAAALDEAPPDLKALALADSLAVDPHKWFYLPVEAGCTLVRDPAALSATYDYSPAYYHFEGDPGDEPVNFYTRGIQNSRGFRALKLWLALRSAGRDGLARMISEDFALAREMFDAISRHPELEPVTCNLSITTFRYVPEGVDPLDPYLNQLNEALLDRIQRGGECFLSNAVIKGVFLLRACIVNFNTNLEDVLAVPEIVARIGRQVHAELRLR